MCRCVNSFISLSRLPWPPPTPQVLGILVVILVLAVSYGVLEIPNYILGAIVGDIYEMRLAAELGIITTGGTMLLYGLPLGLIGVGIPIQKPTRREQRRPRRGT